MSEPQMTMRMTCPCGARFSAEGEASWVDGQADSWRDGHANHGYPVEPGPCWHDPGMTWPTGVSPRCELKAGHAGAHQCDRGSLGGTATWTDADACR